MLHTINLSLHCGIDISVPVLRAETVGNSVVVGDGRWELWFYAPADGKSSVWVYDADTGDDLPVTTVSVSSRTYYTLLGIAGAA